jgi:hypothetical protein
MVRLSSARWSLLTAACGLGVATWLAMRLVAPAADFLPVALVPLICCGALAVALDECGIAGFLPVVLCCALATLAAAFAIRDPRQLALLSGFGSLGLLGAGAYSLAKSTRWPPFSQCWTNWIIGLLLACVLGLYCVDFVTRSRDLMFGDFMYRRVEAIATAFLIDKGRIVDLLAAFVSSMKDEYSLTPALAPGLWLAATSPLSRACYEIATVALYATPAYFALGVLARDLARRARPVRQPAYLALAVCAAFVSYPTGMAVVARGMPDIGGIVLVVAGLRLSERIARILALPPGHDARVSQMARRATLALALTLFGMFLFRRWYAFAAAGILTMLALEVGILAARRGFHFRWRDMISSAALGALLLFGLAAPILIDWLPDPAAHDYAWIYAAYRKDFAVFVAEVFDWYGAALLVGAVGCAIFLAALPGDRRLLRLTWGSTVIAGLLFLRIQSPAIHHAYLLTPAFAATIGAGVLILSERTTIGALVVTAGIAVATLTPAVSAWTPAGLAPTAGRPPAPRSDLAELARLKKWIDRHATPDRRYCILASSYTISDAVADELWQLDPNGSPLFADPSLRTNVGMAHVDTRDGPPVSGLKDCAFMLVGDPIQTHLLRAYQQDVIVPASEMLAGAGIGANYRRSGEVFNLEKGVKLIVFDRVRPLDDADIAALDARWSAARDKDAIGLRGTQSD